MDVVAEAQAIKHQLDFINSDAKFPALVGGYGSGKSAAGIRRAFKLKLQYPENTVAIYSPTYTLLKDYWFEEMVAFADKYGFRYTLNKSDKELKLEGFNKFIMRSMNNPESIISYEVADSIIDELDVLPTHKAKEVWKKILGRNRQVKPDNSANTVGITTTPEGFRFVYENWGNNLGNPERFNYELIQASSLDNPFLPKEYLKTMMEDYDPKLQQAYIYGQFVNLTQGSIYFAFDYENHVVKENSLVIDKNLPVRLCVDFNVNPMVWEITQHIGDKVKVIHEIALRNTNTWKMTEAVKELLPKETVLMIYGDASGTYRDTRSNNTDYTIIYKELNNHFTLPVEFYVPKANPSVRSRFNTVNSRLAKGNIAINESCKFLIADFNQLAYNVKGDVDKTNPDRTHASDAFGYYMFVEFPLAIGQKQAEACTV